MRHRSNETDLRRRLKRAESQLQTVRRHKIRKRLTSERERVIALFHEAVMLTGSRNGSQN